MEIEQTNGTTNSRLVAPIPLPERGGMLSKKNEEEIWEVCPTLFYGGEKPGGQGGLWDSWTHCARIVSASAD